MSRPKLPVRVHGYGGYTAGCRCDEVCRPAKAQRERDRRAGRIIPKAKASAVKPSASWAGTTPVDRSWQGKSACKQADPELFFADDQPSIDDAKKICASCPVSEQCRRYVEQVAVPYGVFAGLDQDERRAVGLVAA